MARIEAFKFSESELELLSLCLQEGNLQTVARQLNTSVGDIRGRRARIMRKLCVKNSLELTIVAMQRRLVRHRGEIGVK